LGTDLSALAASLADDDDLPQAWLKLEEESNGILRIVAYNPNLLRGALILAEEDCGLSLLIVAGPALGRVVSLREYELHFNDAKDFLDWYEGWIDSELQRANHRFAAPPG
jgi:hypothetical protein